MSIDSILSDTQALELLGKYGIEAGLMGLCGYVVYKLGGMAIDRHFKHIERLTKDHDNRIDKLLAEHRIERNQWVIKLNETAERFSQAVDHLKEQFTEIVKRLDNVNTYYQEQKYKR